MIKAKKLVDLFPPSRRVAALADPLKRALVRIPVTVSAAGKSNSLVFRHSGAVLGEEMTFLTRNLLMESRQRKRSPLMIKTALLFPRLEGVTRCAILA